jgi:hypothetical protein
MKYSTSLSNIATALAKIQAEIKNPIKDQINKGVQGAPKYANLEDTLQDYVRPVCAKHGVSVFQSVKSENNQVGVCTVLIHESGEYIESDYVFCEIVIPTNSSGKKILTEGQATGVCITYLRRYSLNAALGINGDKDTDGSYGDKPVEPLTYESALTLEVTFGKHSGKTLQEIYKTDRPYINYLAEKSTDLQIKEAIIIIEKKIAESKAQPLDEGRDAEDLFSEQR